MMALSHLFGLPPNLTNADLSGTNLQEACLRDATLINADVGDAPLHHTYLRDIDLN